MALYFLVTEGPLKGQEFDLKAGFAIGRLQGDIVLNDKKVSLHHARILEEGGQLVLVDNQSTNGLKVDQVRVAKIKLVAGVTVQLGQTFLLVSDRSFPGPALPPPAPPEPAWDEALEEFTHSVQNQVRDQNLPLKPLVTAVQLHFFRGLQVETEWVLGYGPRQIGAQSLEFPIYEPGAPAVCFEISADAQGSRYYTDHPRTVLLNGQAISSALLKEGDTITISATSIEVKLG